MRKYLDSFHDLSQFQPRTIAFTMNGSIVLRSLCSRVAGASLPGSTSAIRPTAISSLGVANFHTTAPLESGHNKWSKIRHSKGLKDVKRGRLFSELSKNIIRASKAAGSSYQDDLGLNQGIALAKKGVRDPNVLWRLKY